MGNIFLGCIGNCDGPSIKQPPAPTRIGATPWLASALQFIHRMPCPLIPVGEVLL